MVVVIYTFMKKFQEWLNDADKERNSKLTAMRVWLWNQSYGNSGQKKGHCPVSPGDPDLEWISKKATRLGPLDPFKHQG